LNSYIKQVVNIRL